MSESVSESVSEFVNLWSIEVLTHLKTWSFDPQNSFQSGASTKFNAA